MHQFLPVELGEDAKVLCAVMTQRFRQKNYSEFKVEMQRTILKILQLTATRSSFTKKGDLPRLSDATHVLM